MSVAFRRANADDARLIAASYFESYRKGGSAPEAAFPVHQKGLNRRLERAILPNAFVAYAKDVPDEIVGWVSCEGPLLHYLYVKLPYRRLGFGKLLLEACPDRATHTHETKGLRFLRAHLRTTFDPYAFE